ncbi:MAG TPA: hypothetical protein VFB62_05515 [Polyangiaceae bacterium]|nr:hypothetical protein [Polyangiaceae bacterium]
MQTRWVLLFALGPLIPRDCDCAASCRQSARLAVEDEVHRAIDAYVAAGDAGASIVRVEDPKTHEHLDVRFGVPKVFVAEADTRHDVSCATGEIVGREPTEPAEVCFTSIRGDNGWSVVEASLLARGPETAKPETRNLARFSCPNHPEYQAAKSGTCPIDRAPLEAMRRCNDGDYEPPTWWCMAGPNPAPSR